MQGFSWSSSRSASVKQSYTIHLRCTCAHCSTLRLSIIHRMRTLLDCASGPGAHQGLAQTCSQGAAHACPVALLSELRLLPRRLVGVATVPKTGSTPIDKFLSLPNEAYAVMSSRFRFHAADTPADAVSSLT